MNGDIMSKFQILCATMHQKDFSKLSQMNIHSDVIFANQADRNEFEQLQFEGHTAKMITTDTRGVGINRNIALLQASADICLLADDDVTYHDDVEATVLKEFERYPDADMIIFNCSTDDTSRKQIEHKKNSKCRFYSRLPYPTFRIAFRLMSIRKANIWFTTLFGGGCIFPSGEDSLFMHDARRKKLTIYRSAASLGTVDFSQSTWFTGRNEKYYYGMGAFAKALNPQTALVRNIYISVITGRTSKISFKERLRWCSYGRKGYQKLQSYSDFVAEKEKKTESKR